MSNPVIVQVTSIICKHLEECEQELARLDELEASDMRSILLQTIHRKQYAMSTQCELLRTILTEIGSEVSA